MRLFVELLLPNITRKESSVDPRSAAASDRGSPRFIRNVARSRTPLSATSERCRHKYARQRAVTADQSVSGVASARGKLPGVPDAEVSMHGTKV
jgi:hypothetical protein